MFASFWKCESVAIPTKALDTFSKNVSFGGVSLHLTYMVVSLDKIATLLVFQLIFIFTIGVTDGDVLKLIGGTRLEH